MLDFFSKNTKEKVSKKVLLIIFVFVFFSVNTEVYAYGMDFDGGELMGIAEVCTCSAGMTINVLSYVDNTKHVYLYSPYQTQLKANYNIMSSNGYFLTTLSSFATCMIYEGQDCRNSNQTPEGTFSIVGTSFKEVEKAFAGIMSLPSSNMISDTISDFSQAFRFYNL